MTWLPPFSNQTGLTGRWNYVIAARSEGAVNPKDDRPSLFTAVQEQLGLRLEKQRGFKDVWIIKSVHFPTEN